MASARVNSRPLATGGPSAGGDEIDDLEDYGLDDDSIFGDSNDPFSKNYKAPELTGANKDAGKSGGGKDKPDDLGIDDLLEVGKKARVPRVKLDENRLLSSAGIPKLRKRAKDHLKFKGKGHEYSDASKLLAFYQLWLDDLFPKARFLDALAMVEKMGHKKRMHSMRMEWINEGKPRSSVHEDSLFDKPTLPPRDNGERERTAGRVAPIFEKPVTEKQKTPDVGGDVDMDDLYDATPRPARRKSIEVESQDSLFGGGASLFGPAKSGIVDDGPEEDDLDALLAEQEMMETEAAKKKPAVTSNVPDSFEDEMEAMAEMDGMWDM